MFLHEPELLHESVLELIPRPLSAPMFIRFDRSVRLGALMIAVERMNNQGVMAVLHNNLIAVYSTWTALTPTGNAWHDEGAALAEDDIFERLQHVKPHVDALRAVASQLLRVADRNVRERHADRLNGYQQGIVEYSGIPEDAIRMRMKAETLLVRGYVDRLLACVPL